MEMRLTDKILIDLQAGDDFVQAIMLSLQARYWYINVLSSRDFGSYIAEQMMTFLVSLGKKFWGQDMGSDCISSWSLLIFLLFKLKQEKKKKKRTRNIMFKWG